MEVFLNAVWLVIAVGSFVGYIQLVPTKRRTLPRDVLTLVCFSILLLPVISITDDLNCETFASDDSNVTKRLLTGVAHRPPNTIVGSFTAASRTYSMLRHASRAIEQIVASCPGPVYIRLIDVRPPPRLL